VARHYLLSFAPLVPNPDVADPSAEFFFLFSEASIKWTGFMCRISIIIIFLDAEAFIKEAIDSVLTQSYRSFELILVDDGSTDASSAIARSYAQNYPDRVRYIEHPQHANRGMSVSRNAGIAVSRGDLIAFNDADDVWMPDSLEERVAVLDAHPEIGLLAGSTVYWNSWQGGEDKVALAGHVHNRVVNPPEALLSVYPLGALESPGICSLLVRRSVIERVGGFEACFTGMYEDQVFLVKVYLNTPVYFSDRIWFKYRRHDASCMAKNAKAGQHDAVRQEFLTWFAQYLTKIGFTDPQVWRKLRSANWPYQHPRLHRILQLVSNPRRIWAGIKRRWPLLRGLVRGFALR
jgi:glycosyltransferase involved in cell wall biosynthesis